MSQPGVALDTNIISQYLAGKPEVVEAVNRLDGFSLPFFVVAELMGGYEGGTRATKSLQVLEELLAADGVATLDSPNSNIRQIFARVYGQLKKSGRMVSIMDIWIAAECIAAGIELFSYDKDMDQIPQLLRYRT